MWAVPLSASPLEAGQLEWQQVTAGRAVDDQGCAAHLTDCLKVPKDHNHNHIHNTETQRSANRQIRNKRCPTHWVLWVYGCMECMLPLSALAHTKQARVQQVTVCIRCVSCHIVMRETWSFTQVTNEG